MEPNEENIVCSPVRVKEVPNCDLWTYVQSAFINKRDAVALIEPLRDISLTFGELNDRVECIVSHLLEFGYNRERPFVIYMNNCVECIMGILVVWRLGGKVALINHLLTVKEINRYLELLEPDYILCNQATATNSLKAGQKTSIKMFLCTDNHAGCFLFSKLFEKPKTQRDFSKNINPKDTAVMAFSSGTTGTPKCVELSHQGFVEVITGLVEATGMNDFSNGGIIYQPMSHAYGIMMLLCFYRSGQKVIIMPQFDLEEYVSYIQQYRTEFLTLVPPIAVILCKTPLLQRYDLSSVRFILCGAAPLAKETELELKGRLRDGVKVRQAYGLTETHGGGCVAIHSDYSTPSGSVGLLYPNTKAKIVDLESGRSLGQNQRGEICFSCNNIMNGYFKNPKATADMIQDGWLHTGDIGYYDENGYFFVVDRLKELIKYKAYQVAPSELEALLLSHPSIADAGVTSLPQEEAGELPQAWVVLKPGVLCTEAEIQAFVAERVAPFKQLRGGVKFVNAIPKSPSGKIMRRIMKQQTAPSKL